MDGAPSHARSLRLQARARAPCGTGGSGILPEGHQDQHAGRRRQALRLQSHLEAVWRERRLVLGLGAQHRAARRQAHLHQVERHRRRDARHLDPQAQHRRREPGPSVARRLDHLCARLRQSRSAALCRSLQRQARAARRLGQLELRLPAGGLSGHGLPSRSAADPASGAAGAHRPSAAARQSRSTQEAERASRRRASRRHRTRSAHALL